MSDREQQRVVAVIQARIGSTRFPGKVLKPVAGKPLLWHIVHRLRKSQRIDEIAVATSTNPRDDVIVEFCRRNGVRVIRGSEDNVLARFAQAAETLDADVVVRVCSDAPFVDPGFIDHLVDALIAQQGGYVTMEAGAISAHEGVDVFSRRALDKLMMDAADDPVAREHVAGYFRLHPDFVATAYAKPYPKLAHAVGRLTIDTPDDLAFVEAVHARLEARAGEASLADLLLLLEREPALRRINAHVRQKDIAPQGGLALIRCDGGAAFGYGRVRRMIALARALRDVQGIGAVFAVHGGEDALTLVRAAGFEARQLSVPQAALAEVVAKPDILVVDCEEGPSRDEIALAPLSAVIEDRSERRLAAGFAYYAPSPQADGLDWSGSRCTVHTGWEWMLTGLSQTNVRPRARSPRPTLLIAMGGSDPHGLTLRAAQALSSLDPVFRARFVIGPGFAGKERLARTIVGMHENFETIEGAGDLATEFAVCDAALTALGVTAGELAAFGVPALYFCASEEQALSASAFEQAGLGISLGLAATASDQAIAKAVWALLSDGIRRREMRHCGLMTVDGRAALRIAAELGSAHAARRAVTSRQAAG